MDDIKKSHTDFYNRIVRSTIWRDPSEAEVGFSILLPNVSLLINKHFADQPFKIKDQGWFSKFEVELSNVNLSINEKGLINIDVHIHGFYDKHKIPVGTKIKGNIHHDLLTLESKRKRGGHEINILLDLAKPVWPELKIGSLNLKMANIFKHLHMVIYSFSIPNEVHGVQIHSFDASNIIFTTDVGTQSVIVGYNSSTNDLSNMIKHMVAHGYVFPPRRKGLLVGAISNDFLLRGARDLLNDQLAKVVTQSRSSRNQPLLDFYNLEETVDYGKKKYQTVLRKQGSERAQVNLKGHSIEVSDLLISFGVKWNELTFNLLTEIHDPGVDIESVAASATVTMRIDQLQPTKAPKFHPIIDSIHPKMKHWYDYLIEGPLELLVNGLIKLLVPIIENILNTALSDKQVMNIPFLDEFGLLLDSNPNSRSTLSKVIVDIDSKHVQ